MKVTVAISHFRVLGQLGVLNGPQKTSPSSATIDVLALGQ